MSNELLGELEHRILLAVLALGSDAYSVSIALHLEGVTGRSVALATLHVTLRRLEAKGLVRSELRAAPADEGGRERRCYRILPAGQARVREARAELDALWRVAGDAPAGGR